MRLEYALSQSFSFEARAGGITLIVGSSNTWDITTSLRRTSFLLRMCSVIAMTWRGDALQARRQIRRLAYDSAFLGLAGAADVTDHDQAGRNADADWSGSASRSVG